MRKRDPILCSFGQGVAKHRRAKGLSQEALAKKADLDRTYLERHRKAVGRAGLFWCSIARFKIRTAGSLP